MKLLTILSLAAVAGSSFAGTYFYDGVLSTSSSTFHHPSASTAGTALQYYSMFEFTVDFSGSYVIETASPNTSTGLSNALDTFLAIYATTFTPATPGAGLSFNDDFTGSLTVLPGPYAGTVSTTSTGFTGLQPGSRMPTVALTAGTSYFLVNTSFRSTDFVATGTNGQPVGHYYTGISGPGTIIPSSPVPEPASLAVLGLGALVLLRRRRK